MTKTGLRVSGTMALCVLFLTAGCGGGGGGGGSSSTTAGSASAYDALFTDPTNTVNVTPTQDAARATTQLVTAATGATLTATDANGNQLSLAIPAGALSIDTTITMTPLASVPDLPFAGGLVAGVQFEPEGLYFDHPAKLTIVLANPSSVPVLNQTFFGYSGSGNDLYLAPPADKTSAITLFVQHFSGGGVANATTLERGAMELKRAASSESRLTQIVAEALTAARQQAILGTTDGLNVPTVDGYFSSYWNLVVSPLVNAAGTSCKNAYVGRQKYLFLARQYELLGLQMPYDPGGAALSALDQAISTNCNGLPFRFRGTFTTNYQNGPAATGTVTYARDDYACAAAQVTFAFGTTACFTVESVSYTSTAAYTDIAGCTHAASGNVKLSNTSALDSNLQVSTTANAGMHDYAVAGWWHKVFPKAETITCPGPFVYTVDYYADAALASTQQGQAYPTTDGVTAAGAFTSSNTYQWSLKAAQ